MVFICYPKCTTCQKARRLLDSLGVEYTERDIKLQNPTREELERWLRESGADIKKLFNTSGILYRSMSLKDRLPDMSENELLDLLSSDGMLVKRPILITDRGIAFGFNEERYRELCGK